MYPTLLTLHGWLRWAALLAVVLVFARALRGVTTNAPWRPADLKWMKGAAHTLNVQFIIGIFLFAVSPYIRSLLGDMGGTMSDRTSRFFAVEHATMMLLAVAATHGGTVIAAKGATDGAKHKRAAIAFGIALALLAYGIPWARPLFRMGM